MQHTKHWTRYEHFDSRNRYIGYIKIIISHCMLWDVITYTCPMYLFWRRSDRVLSSKTAWVKWSLLLLSSAQGGPYITPWPLVLDSHITVMNELIALPNYVQLYMVAKGPTILAKCGTSPNGFVGTNNLVHFNPWRVTIITHSKIGHLQMSSRQLPTG